MDIHSNFSSFTFRYKIMKNTLYTVCYVPWEFHFHFWFNSCLQISSGQIINLNFLSSWLYLPRTSIVKSKGRGLPCWEMSVYIVKAMVFPVVMNGCVSWTIKKPEHQRTDAFEQRWWRRLLRVPWTARRSNQSILKEIKSEYSFEGLMLKLKLQYFGHLMQKTDSLEKTLILGKIEGKRRTGRERIRWWDSITFSMDMNLSKLPEIVKDRGA